MVNDVGRDWHSQINLALWAYQTNIRTPTGATPYALVYGSEAILPIEVEIVMPRYTTLEEVAIHYINVPIFFIFFITNNIQDEFTLPTTSKAMRQRLH